MSCQLCGANPATDPTIALSRVNEKGVPGIWQCAYGTGCDKWEDLRKTKPAGDNQ